MSNDSTRMTNSRPESDASSTSHLPAIDVLRGVSILAVIWHHYGYSAHQSGWWLDKYGASGFVATWVTNGWLGVNLFFILSGFVLYWPFATGRRQLADKKAIINFYSRRSQRLLPLYFFSVAVLAGLVATPSIWQSIALLTLSFNFHKLTFFPTVNWVLWSLGIEIWFSIIFPIILIAVNRYGIRSVFVVVLISSLLFRLLGVLLPGAAIEGNPFLNPVKDSIVGRLDDFLVGMMAAHCVIHDPSPSRPKLSIIVGVLMCTIASLWFDYTTYTASAAIIFGNSIFQAGAFLVIIGAVSISGFRLFGLELLGLMCYSIYVWHGVIMNHTQPHLGVTQKLIFLGLLSTIAWLSYRYIEFGHVQEVRRLLPMPALAGPSKAARGSVMR